jgi:hypothetical protein
MTATSAADTVSMPQQRDGERALGARHARLADPEAQPLSTHRARIAAVHQTTVRLQATSQAAAAEPDYKALI